MRYELNIKIEFHEEKELKIIYDEFVKIIEDNFKKEEKNLNNIIYSSNISFFYFINNI